VDPPTRHLTVRFFVDDQLVRAADQRIDYPLQLMVDRFEFPRAPTATRPRTQRLSAAIGDLTSRTTHGQRFIVTTSHRLGAKTR
jgi:hypothetical protein